jgi:hypothetical protein
MRVQRVGQGVDDESVYDRRRADLLADKRMDRIEVKVDQLTRYVFLGSGMIMVVVFLMNIIGPVIVNKLIGP